MNRKLNELEMSKGIRVKTLTKYFTLLHFNGCGLCMRLFFRLVNFLKIDQLRFVFLMNRLSNGVFS